MLCNRDKFLLFVFSDAYFLQCCLHRISSRQKGFSGKTSDELKWKSERENCESNDYIWGTHKTTVQKACTDK